MSTQHVLDLSNMTIDNKPIVLKTTMYDFTHFMISKIFKTEQPKKNITSPTVYCINYNLYDIFKDIFSPHFDGSASAPKKDNNEKSDINILNISSMEILLRKYKDFFLIDAEESVRNDPTKDFNKPIKQLYDNNITGTNKSFMNVIFIKNSGLRTGKNKELHLFNSMPPTISIYLYISDNFETSKLKIINKTKNLYKVMDSSFSIPYAGDGETIEYKDIDLNDFKCPECQSCPKCPAQSFPECSDIKPYEYSLYVCGVLIFILSIFLFYNLTKSKNEIKK
jgi:hypothetical protein